MPKAIPISSYNREVRIPIGKASDMGSVDLNEEVEITIKGKIKRLEAERPAGEEYKDQAFRPAEICIEISSVSLGDKESIFTTLSRKMDEDMGVEPY
jgi:hypothetical protein